MIGVHRVLREETAEVHEALHGHPVFVDLFAGRLDVAAYSALMARLYGFYRGIDPAIAQASRCNRQRLGSVSYSPRSTILARDIEALGGSHLRREPVCSDVPVLASAASAAGALYVIEGSALGGGQMRKALMRQRIALPAAAMGYWTWCAQTGAPAWKTTLDRLLEVPKTDAELREMAGAASATFTAFEAWFEPLGARPAEPAGL